MHLIGARAQVDRGVRPGNLDRGPYRDRRVGAGEAVDEILGLVAPIRDVADGLAHQALGIILQRSHGAADAVGAVAREKLEQALPPAQDG